MRIVSLAPSVTEVLFALGVDAELVGVTRYCDFPDAAKEKPKMGGWLDVDFAKVRSVYPDIVFTSSIVQRKVCEEAKKWGFNVVHTDPRSLPEFLESIEQVGCLVDREKQARELIAKLQSGFNSLREGAKDDVKLKVYVEEWPMMVSANWVPDILEILNAKSLSQSGQPSYKVTTEEVLNFDPDVIVLSWCGFGDNVSKEKVTQRAGWSALKAVKNNRIIVLHDSVLNRPGPRLLEGARLLAKLI